MSIIQRLAFLYFFMFLFIVLIGYVPAFNDENGMLFGLFSLQIHDDILHLFSGIWAGLAGYFSRVASVKYFKIFGILYGLDGLLGLITGSGYLDLGIVFHGVSNLDLLTKILANTPHIAIGGFAVFVGFYLSKKFN